MHSFHQPVEEISRKSFWPSLGLVMLHCLSIATSAAVAPPSTNAWKVIHSLTNPFNGGSPEMATAPSRNSQAVHGMRRASPPNSSMLRVLAVFFHPRVKKQEAMAAVLVDAAAGA